MARRRVMDTNFRGGLSFDEETVRQLKKALQELESAVRRQVLDEALLDGAEIIHDAAESRAPGPHILVELMGGRKLKFFQFADKWKIVKSNARYAAIGPDNDYWFYRFFEFGATRHDISVRKPGLISFKGDVVKAWAKMSGGVKKRPFLRPAVDGYGQQAIDVMGKSIRAEIEKAAKA